jgi:hypothetical protein
MFFQCIADFIGQREELHAGIEVLGVLPEDGYIDIIPVIERIARVGFAGAQVGSEIKLLAQPHDRRKICQAFTAEFGHEFIFGFFFGFRCYGPEQGAICLFKRFDCSIRERIALFSPELPADIGVNIFSVKFDFIEDYPGGFHYVVTDTVPGHPGYFIFWHSGLLLIKQLASLKKEKKHQYINYEITNKFRIAFTA